MTIETALAVVLLIALTLYALLGGADFGAGVWHLLAHGPTRRDEHHLIGEAIGPIWEANHVWLILIVTVLFTAFPVVYAQISITLHIPVTLLVIGIVLRGATFAFRHYDIQDDDIHLRWEQIFAASSVMSPLLLGIILGSVTAGNFPPTSYHFFDGYVDPWLRPFPLTVGLLTLSLFMYLAVTYLLLETKNRQLQDIFRRRAIASALVVGVLEELALILGKSAAPRLWGELTASVWGNSMQLGVGLLTAAAVWFLITRRYWWARSCVAAQIILSIWAWGIAQFPYLIPPYLTVFNASAPEPTLRFVMVALCLGALLLFPSLYYLFRIFKGRSLYDFNA